jgi:hypothetical protein
LRAEELTTAFREFLDSKEHLSIQAIEPEILEDREER